MRVVVTGGGAIGRHVAADLVVRGHEVTLIEQDRPTVEDLRAEVPEVNVMLATRASHGSLRTRSWRRPTWSWLPRATTRTTW